MDILTQAARDVADCAHGQTAAIYQRTAATLGVSEGRAKALVAQQGKALGLAEPRKRRSDAGQTAMTDDELRLVAGAMLHDYRRSKEMLTVEAAVKMLRDSGMLANPLSHERVTALLHQRGLHPRQLRRPTAHTPMRTSHINAVWQMDFSVSVFYRAPEGERIAALQEGVHYKNKAENLLRDVPNLLVRAVATEHASGAIMVRYYMGGETAQNALDFLMWCMTQRHGASGAMPVHGVPFMIYTDQGSAFKNSLFINFNAALDIKLRRHAPRAARGTGQVENAQNLWERYFESRLRFIPGEQITRDGLNRMAEVAMHAYNGTHKHGRHGMTRYEAWSLIQPQHLRIAPPMDVMRALPATVAEPRTVGGDKRISFKWRDQPRQDFDLRYVPGVSPGDKVLVTVNPYAMPAVRVGVTDRDTGEIVWHNVEPAQAGWLGYDAAAPDLGAGEYRPQPATPADVARATIDAQAFATDGVAATPTQVMDAKRKRATPYLDQLDPLADIKAAAAALPTYLLQRGTEHLAQAAPVETLRVSVAEAAKRTRAALGAAYRPETYGWFAERFGEQGVPVDVINALIAQQQVPKPDAATEDDAPRLRVVGGGA